MGLYIIKSIITVMSVCVCGVGDGKGGGGGGWLHLTAVWDEIL